MIRSQRAQHPGPRRRVCGEPDEGRGVDEGRDEDRRRRTPAPGVFAVDCGGIQDHLSAPLGSQTTSPASTRVAPTLQLKLILFPPRLETAMDTCSAGRTG